jgi:hypothetical protein
MEPAFIDFVVLLVISAIVGAVLHYWFDYYVGPGLQSYFGKWFPALSIGSVDILAAAVGTLAMLVFAVDMGRMFAPETAKKK